jgi:hypothetical protein
MVNSAGDAEPWLDRRGLAHRPGVWDESDVTNDGCSISLTHALVAGQVSAPNAKRS